jgi:hypothetical protein
VEQNQKTVMEQDEEDNEMETQAVLGVAAVAGEEDEVEEDHDGATAEVVVAAALHDEKGTAA